MNNHTLQVLRTLCVGCIIALLTWYFIYYIMELMMHCIVYLEYFIVVTYKHSRAPITHEEFNRVLCNVLITFMVYITIYYAYSFPHQISIINIPLFYIAQDIYFYAVHRLFHMIPLLHMVHSTHHQVYDAWHAFNAHPLDHTLLNIGSFVIPFALFPQHKYVYVVMCIQEIYSAVDRYSYAKNAKCHIIHHTNHKKRFGTIYAIDRLLGTY